MPAALMPRASWLRVICSGKSPSSASFRREAREQVCTEEPGRKSPSRWDVVSKTDTKTTFLRNARVVLPDGVAERAILVEDGRISRLLEGSESGGARGLPELDLRGLTVYPGFIDVHIHGAGGVDTLEATAEDLHTVARRLAASGVTAWPPTLRPPPAGDYPPARRAI